MDDYFEALSNEEKAVLSTIANFVFSLGYRVRRDKTRALSYTFAHNKVKKRILRFSNQKGKPIIKLKFYAAPSYSRFFHEAVRTVIEEWDYRYTGCYGCGKCDGTEGYTYSYPDGRQVYRCGTELIEIADITNIPVAEVLYLLKTQHDHFVSGLQMG